MATQIAFTDAIGAATLTSVVPYPGNRFFNWTPISVPIGESAELQATGAILMFPFRYQYGASFELRSISSIGTGSPLVAPSDIADRLRLWLMNGGTCSVATGDSVASTYSTCGLMPGTTPELVLSDPGLIEYTLRLSLINLAGSPVRMVARYSQGV